MISVIYWIAAIALSLVFQSWTIFCILLIIWVIWMIIRGLAKYSSEGNDFWVFTDIENSVNDSFDFGGGDFGGGGSDSSWGDSDGGGDGGGD